MSKLTDKIRKATRLQSTPMGFGAARAGTAASMVLGGTAKDAGGAADLAKAGADVIVLDQRSGVSQAPTGLGDIALGAAISGKTAGEAAAAKAAGFDFVVFDPDEAAATALLEEEIGYVLVLPDDLAEPDLRTLEAFQLDAVDVGAVHGSLTVRRQIALRRIFATTRKPLAAGVPADISLEDLQVLRDTNVVVVMATTADAVVALRKAIDALPPRKARRDGDERPTPLVPRTTALEEDEGEE